MDADTSMATSLDNFFMKLVLVCNTTEFCLFEKQYAQRYNCFFNLQIIFTLLKKNFRPFFSVLYQTMPQRTNQNIRTNEIRYINGLKR